MKGERKRLGPSCGRMTSIHIAPDGKEPIAGRKCGLGGHRGLDLQCLASSLAGASRGGRGGPLPLAITLPCILCTVPGMCESARTVQDGRHGAAAQWRHAEYSVRTGPERPRAGHARTRTPAGLSAVSQSLADVLHEETRPGWGGSANERPRALLSFPVSLPADASPGAEQVFNGPYHDNPGPNCFTKKSAHDNNRRSPEDPIIEYKCRSAKACQGLDLLERSAACHCWQLVRVRRKDLSPVHPGPRELLPYQHSEVSLKTRPLDSNHFDSVLCVQAPLRSAPWVGVFLRVFLQTTLHDNNDADDYWYQSY